MPSVCLCSIVRNEEKNIIRCLDAAKAVLDFVSICDTGSTDNTVALILQWGQLNDIPTVVHRESFRDFGYNRSRAAELARSSFESADYLLLLDADHVLMVDDEWNPDELVADSYLLHQRSSVLSYWNIRLIKTSIVWRCEGVTHEFWTTDITDASRERLATIRIDDLEDGGFKAEKFERDRRLLEGALANSETPSHLLPRYHFYLAQTFRDLKDFSQARHWYDVRSREGGFAEEVYMSLVERAVADSQLEQSADKVISQFLEAFRFRPSRAEALWRGAEFCRQGRLFAEGYVFAKAGIGMTMPDDLLFVRRDVYEWRLLDEFAVCAYWIDHISESVRATEQLISERRYPDDQDARIKENLRFGKERLLGSTKS